MLLGRKSQFQLNFLLEGAIKISHYIFCGPSHFHLIDTHLRLASHYGYSPVIVSPEKLRLKSSEHLSDLDLDLGGIVKQKLMKMVSRRSVGWYYQQYLKLKLSSLSSTKILIQDGDTFLRYEKLMMLASQNILFTTKEDVGLYNRLFDLAFNEVDSFPSSFIANLNVFDPIIWDHIPNLESFFLKWVQRSQSDYDIDFSEYQIAGNLMINSGYDAENLSIFRRGDLILDHQNFSFEKLSPKFDAVAFENTHRNSLLIRLANKIKYYGW